MEEFRVAFLNNKECGDSVIKANSGKFDFGVKSIIFKWSGARDLVSFREFGGAFLEGEVEVRNLVNFKEVLVSQRNYS